MPAPLRLRRPALPVLVALLLVVRAAAAQPAECTFTRADAEAPRLVLPREADDFLRAHAAQPFVQAYLIGLAAEVLPEGDAVRTQARAFACDGAPAPGPGELLAALRAHAARSAEPRTSDGLLVRTTLLLDDLRLIPGDPAAWILGTRGALRDLLDPLTRSSPETGGVPSEALGGARRVLTQADRLDVARRTAAALVPQETDARRRLDDARTRARALLAATDPYETPVPGAAVPDSATLAEAVARRSAALADTAQAALVQQRLAAQRLTALATAERLTDSLRLGVPRLRADLAVLAQWLRSTSRTFVRDSVAVPVPALAAPMRPRGTRLADATAPSPYPSEPGADAAPSSGNLVFDVLNATGRLVWRGVRQRALQSATDRLSRSLLGDDLQERLLPATRRVLATRATVDAAEALRRGLTEDFVGLPARLLGDTLTARLAFVRAQLGTCPRPRRGEAPRAECTSTALNARFDATLRPVVLEVQPLFRAAAELATGDEPDRVSRVFEAAPLFVGEAAWAGSAAPAVQAAARVLSGLAFERRLQGASAPRTLPYVLDGTAYARAAPFTRPAYLRLLAGSAPLADLDARGWAEATAEVGQTLALVDSSVTGCRRDRLCYYRAGLRVLGGVAALGEVLAPAPQVGALQQVRLRWRRLVDVQEALARGEFSGATVALGQAFAQAGEGASALPPVLEARLVALARIAEAPTRAEVERLLADRLLERTDAR